MIDIREWPFLSLGNCISTNGRPGKAARRMGIRKHLARVRSAMIRIAPPRPKPLILMYHRVAADPIDPWALAVMPSHFAEQVEVLRSTRLPLPLEEFVRRLEADKLPDNAVAVTFDDGYLDNLTNAKPLLSAAGVPATVFIATSYLGEQFWWDELARLLLAREGPSSLRSRSATKPSTLIAVMNAHSVRRARCWSRLKPNDTRLCGRCGSR